MKPITTFTDDIETRASLSRLQIPMSYNQGLGILPAQPAEEYSQSRALRFDTGICRLPVGVESANVTNPDGVPVVVLAMRPNHFVRSSRFDAAVRGNHVVVSTAYPAERTMIAVDVRHPQGTARLVGGAVYDDKSNGTHRLKADWKPLLRPLRSVPTQGF